MVMSFDSLALDSDDAIDLGSDGPELAFLWCVLFHVFKISEMRWESSDFFDLYDLAIVGKIHVQGFFDLMGDPTDAIGGDL